MEIQSQHQTYENFVRKLIDTFKKSPALWKKEDPNYKSREIREKAMNNLLEVASEFFPDANTDFVKTKLDNIRGGFKREYKKVMESKKEAKTDEDIYVPALWYYNRLLFLVGEQYEGEGIEEFKDNSRSLYAWTKPNTVILIDLLRKYPILYTNNSNTKGNKSKRVKAYNDLTKEVNAETGSSFAISDIKVKISTLKHQFRRELKRKADKHIKMSSLWCYDLMLFMNDSPGCMSNNKKGANEENSSEGEDMEETIELNSEDNDENLYKQEETEYLENDNDESFCKQEETEYLEKDKDDIFDIIGKSVAMKLRDMSDDQRLQAERLINTIMYHGLMGHLTSNTELTLS